MNRSFHNIHISFYKAAILLILCAFVPFNLSAAESSKQQEFILVLDPGHGGNDVGATDNGAKEKDINLGVAKKVAELVKKKLKNSKVVMTRDNDTFISLQERANIANRNRANLFVSIHTNSVDKTSKNRTTVAGTSVYALGLHKDQNNLNVARRENSVIELESDYKQKYSGFDPSKDESYIIFEMAQKKNLGNSLKFANLAQKQLVAVADRVDRGVKQAGFWVLWATTMPSVLIELDFICNPTSAEFMTSEQGQQKLAQAIYNAIECYAEGHTHALNETHSTSVEKVDKKVTEPISQTAVQTIVEDNSAENAVATLSNSSKKKSVAPTTTSQTNRRTGKPRKRRSDSAKKLSDSKEFETDKILITSEETYLAKVEAAKEETVKETKSDNNSKNKNKKNKNKKNKSEKKSKKVEKSETLASKATTDSKKVVEMSNKEKSTKKESYKKTILVASNGQVHNVEDKNGVRTITPTLYKIQILASAEKIAENSPRFQGLSPVSCFQENGLYKYTYGESTSRSEIENKLYDVKSKFPDAFIIVSKK
jgi:N-acetylmuramoyl-L-alanine amidase